MSLQELAVGAVLDERYRIDQLVAVGSQSTVYRAFDLTVGRPVGIKFIHEATQRQTLERLGRELTAFGRLKHPHIVAVLAFGESAAGAFIVQEWIDGRTLETVLENGALPPERAFAVAAQIGSALQYAHDQGFIHRDLKPSNVLLAVDGTAMLLDFGLAGLLKHSSNQTEAGQIFGTPYYMSPEQFGARPQSAATDVYGLALLLHVMLTGANPFASLEGFGEVFSAILAASIPPLPPGLVSPSLEKLLRAALQADPTERPPLATLCEALTLEPPDAPRAALHMEATGGVRPGGHYVAPERPVQQAAAPSRWVAGRLAAATLSIALVALVVLAFKHAHQVLPARSALGPIALGFMMVVGSFLLAAILKSALTARESMAQSRATELLTGARSRDLLSKSIAIEIDGFLENLRTLDAGVMRASLAILLNELEGAKDSKDRQSALMNVVTILDKLTTRMTPWYVRYKDTITTCVAVVGAASGVATVVVNAIKASK